MDSKNLNIRWGQATGKIESNCGLWYRADIWIVRRGTGIVEATTGIHSSFVVNFAKVRYVILWSPCVWCEIITEAIHSESFQEFPYSDKPIVLVFLKPVEKQFPTIINCHTHSNISTQLHPTTLHHPELLQRKIWLPWLVVWVHLVNQIKKLRYEMGTRNRENWDIRFFSG